MFGTTKKTTTFVMTVSLLMGQLCTPAITSSGDELSVPGLGSYGYEDISEYVSSELPKFIRVYDPETECAYYSDMIPIYNAESEVRAYTVFVKDDDQALGQFTVACIHGELSASFVFTDYSEYVTELIDQGAEFVLFNDGSGLCLYGDGYVESLSNSNDVRLEAPEYTQCPSLPINGYDFSRIQMADRAWLPPSLYR